MKISTNEEPGKIFIGGLTRTTTKEMLENEFSKFGDVIDAIIMKNNETGQSRGFGFITYRDPKSATLAANTINKVDGKTVDVKLSNTKVAAQQRMQKQLNENCKIFIGGLPHGVSDEEVKQFFQRYGPVREFKMMYDDVKKRPRGFGFITFELEESANQVLMEHYISFKGKQIEVKPQLHNSKQQQQQNPLAQFSWNPATASIEPTWSTISNAVATAAANVYGNTPNSNSNSNQWDNTYQPVPDALSAVPSAPWAGYYNGQAAPNQMPNLNYYGQPQQPGYYQAENTTTSSSSLDHIHTSDYDNYSHNYTNTNVAQNQYYNNNNSSSSNKLNNNNSNYRVETTSAINNNVHNTYQQQANDNSNSHYNKHKDNNQRQQQQFSSSSNSRQFHPYRR